MVMVMITSPIKLEPFREIGQGLEDVEDVEVFDVFFGAFPYISLPRLMNNQTSWSLAVQDVQDGKGLCCIDLDKTYDNVRLDQEI